MRMITQVKPTLAFLAVRIFHVMENGRETGEKYPVLLLQSKTSKTKPLKTARITEDDLVTLIEDAAKILRRIREERTA